MRSQPPLPAGAKPWLHDFALWLGKFIYVSAYRIRFRGRERIPATGPVVLVANHTSFVEPQILFGMQRRRAVFLVKSEMARGPLKLLLPWLGQLFIVRGTPDRGPLMAAVEFLRAGGLIGVFPEGGRGLGDVAYAEQGAAWLVRSSGAVVVPAAVRGTDRPKGSGWRFRPVVDVWIGEPFTVTVARGRSGLTAATEQIRVGLADLVRELDDFRGQG